MYVRGDVGQPCARHKKFPPYGNHAKALQGPLFEEGELGDSGLCLLGGGGAYSIKTVLGLQPLPG